MKSKKFNVVKKWYDSGKWNIEMVRNAVVMNWITAEEYFEITNEVYIPE